MGESFSTNEEDFGRTDVVRRQLPTRSAAPIRERFQPLPPLLYQEMRTLLSGMLQGGIITDSTSPWAAPIVMVKKKDGRWRFCVDYRKLNSVTHKDVSHTKTPTAFTTPLGLFEFQRMPFGLCNAPVAFQHLMQRCLNGQITESPLMYLDDIIVYSPDFDIHLKHLDEVFECL